MEEATGLSRGALRLRPERRLDDTARERFAALVERRAKREPLQHVVGHWPFLELDLLCDRRALVPRPETEDLALRAREHLAPRRAPLALDVGTGTGCLALALAAAHPGVRVIALDVSMDALALARENARRTALQERVLFLRTDVVEGFRRCAEIDLIVANLPYIAPSELSALEPEVRDHEPRQALVAEDDGLALILALWQRAPLLLRAGGVLLSEMDPRQVPRVVALAQRGPWQDVRALPDRYGRARFVEARRAKRGGKETQGDRGCA